MTLTDFLRAVLPPEGWYYCGYTFTYFSKKHQQDKETVKHYLCNDIDRVVKICKYLDSVGKNAYFALASYYSDDNPPPEEPTNKGRKTANARELKSFWLDIDCGEGKPFADQRAGLLALRTFLDDTQLPAPSYIVSSGSGLHVYWTLTEALTRDAWIPLGNSFKALTLRAKINADPKPTGNPAQILRAIGTHNYKHAPRPVRIIGPKTHHHITPEVWKQALVDALEAAGLNPLTAGGRPHTDARTDSPFAAGLYDDTPPVDAELLADKCQVFGHMRATKGADYGYDLWVDCIATLRHSIQGVEVCEDWSSGHDSYVEGIAASKLDDLTNHAPRRCESFRQHDDGKWCDGCPYDIPSPYRLGFTTAESVTTAAAPDGTVEDVPALPDTVIEAGFAWDGRSLTGTARYKDKKTGEWVEYSTTICNQLVVINYVYQHDDSDRGLYAALSVRVKTGEWHDADISFGAIGAGGNTLARDLGAHAGIFAAAGQKPLLETYMQTWADHVRTTTDLKIMRRHLGWQDNGDFLLGTTLYRPNDDPIEAVVSSTMAKYVTAHKPRGDLKRYCQLVRTLYGRDDRLIYQYALVSAVASILPALVDRASRGMVVALVSQASGRGKTAVAKLGIGVWGDPEASGQSASSNLATPLALYTMAGQRHHLPVLIDEITEWPDEKIVEFLYSYNNGTPKLQAKAEGGLRDNAHLSWCNTALVTSNRSLIEKLRNRSRNATPQISRLIELRIPHTVTLDPDERPLIDELLNHHHAVLGHKLIPHIVNRRDQIVKRIDTLRTELTKELDLGSEARFWVMQIASVLVAFKLVQPLFKFDETAFTDYCKDILRHMDSAAKASQLHYGDVFATMMLDIQPGLIVTTSFGAPGGDHYAQHYYPPKVKPTGRVVVRPDGNNDAWIPISVVRQWCSDNGHDYPSLRDHALKHRLISGSQDRVFLTKGLPIVTARQRCWTLNAKECQNVLYDVTDAPLNSATP